MRIVLVEDLMNLSSCQRGSRGISIGIPVLHVPFQSISSLRPILAL
jgi:hypothetical protein